MKVEVTVEWNTGVGLHSEPLSVHFAGEADPHKVIGAVTEAMGIKSEPKLFKSGDGEYPHILCTENDKVTVFCANGEAHVFPSWREACDYIVAANAEITEDK